VNESLGLGLIPIQQILEEKKCRDIDVTHDITVTLSGGTHISKQGVLKTSVTGPCIFAMRL
jgi:hypothetical protein